MSMRFGVAFMHTRTRPRMLQFVNSLERLILGNPISDWLAAAGVALGVAVALLIIKYFVGRRLATIAARTSSQLDDLVVDLIERTRLYFIVALAIRAGSPLLTFPPAIHEAIRDLTTIAVLLQLARWATGLIHFWLARWARSRAGGDERATSATFKAIGAIAQVVVWLVVILLALKNVWGFDITALVTGLGVGGIAVALAVQNILGDAFAALSIVLDKPFDIGDTIAVDTFVGQVEHIGLKTTRIRALGGEQVIFANSELLKSRVRNLRRMMERRIVFTIGATYDTPPDLVAQVPTIIRTIIEGTPNTRFDRAHFARYMDSSLEFEAVYYVTSPEYVVYMDAHHAINLALLREFNGRGISFAFPTRTIIQQTVDGGPGEAPATGTPGTDGTGDGARGSGSTPAAIPVTAAES